MVVALIVWTCSLRLMILSAFEGFGCKRWFVPRGCPFWSKGPKKIPSCWVRFGNWLFVMATHRVCFSSLKTSLFEKGSLHIWGRGSNENELKAISYKTEFMCFILFANRFSNKVLNGIKTFFNRIKNNNNVEKPVREQDKTFLFRWEPCSETCWRTG